MKVRIEINGKEKEFDTCSVEIVYEGLPNEDGSNDGRLHAKLSHEGLILDRFDNDQDDDPRTAGYEVCDLESLCH